jgi:hypothetical protein
MLVQRLKVQEYFFFSSVEQSGTRVKYKEFLTQEEDIQKLILIQL